MNCPTAHQRLLALERPAQPTGELRQHLEGCPACRAWQQRLLALEAQAAHAAVPSPTRKAEFLLQFQDAPVAGPRPIVRLPSATPPVPRKERGLQKLSVAVALAASLVVFALGWWLWPQPTPTEPSNGVAQESGRLLAARLEHDRRWTDAHTTQARLEVLSSLADEVQAETRVLARAGRTEELSRQAQLFREVVHEGILKQAESLDLPTSERYLLLTSLARKLEAAGTEAEALAADVPTVAQPLRQIALAAREGKERLNTLASRA